MKQAVIIGAGPAGGAMLYADTSHGEVEPAAGEAKAQPTGEPLCGRAINVAQQERL